MVTNRYNRCNSKEEVIVISKDNQSIALGLLKKILLKELYQRLDVAKGRLSINDRELSENVGQASNWFNDGKHNMEDMRISSFLRIWSYMSSEMESKTPDDSSHQKIELEEIFTRQVTWIASIYISIKDEKINADAKSVYNELKNQPNRMRTLNATLSSLKDIQNKFTTEELKYLSELLSYINN